jgi:hypothetical protein
MVFSYDVVVDECTGQLFYVVVRSRSNGGAREGDSSTLSLLGYQPEWLSEAAACESRSCSVPQCRYLPPG